MRFPPSNLSEVLVLLTFEAFELQRVCLAALQNAGLVPRET